MTSRREFLQLAAATAALMPAGWTRALAQQQVTQAELLKFEPLGNVTLVHVTDLHGQLMPVLFREPSVNLGVGEARGQVPHITGRDFLDRYKIPAGSRAAYALTSEDFTALAKSYGRIGGLDRIATVLKSIRAERDGRTLFLDGGDTWQNSYTSMVTHGQDMVDCMALLRPDAMTGHWEFTLGTERVKEIVKGLGFPFLAQNVRDTEWDEPAFEAMRMVERGGVKIAIIGQALPYTAIANPRWMIPNWSFGIRENDLRGNVEKARKEGAQLVVLLSHNGFDVDRKLAGRVPGIDVILTAPLEQVLEGPRLHGRPLAGDALEHDGLAREQVLAAELLGRQVAAPLDLQRAASRPPAHPVRHLRVPGCTAAGARETELAAKEPVRDEGGVEGKPVGPVDPSVHVHGDANSFCKGDSSGA